jgi:hypothetical protein
MDEPKELNEIKRCIPLIGKTPDIVDGFMEGDVINLLILLAKYKYNNEFEYTCKCISETEYESFTIANNYMLGMIEYHKELCKKNQNCIINMKVYLMIGILRYSKNITLIKFM